MRPGRERMESMGEREKVSGRDRARVGSRETEIRARRGRQSWRWEREFRAGRGRV